MQHHRYQKAPVVEAVIDFRFSSLITKADLGRIVRRLKGKFPRLQDEVAFGVAVSPTGVNINQSPSGYKLSSTDDLKLVLLRPNGVTNSILAPYKGWEVLRDQTEATLADVRRIINRRPIQRIGLRYINRLDIPSMDVKLADWVSFNVSLPKGLGEVLSEFGARAVIPMGGGISTILSFQSVPSPLIDHSSLLLDLDVFIDKDIPLADEPLWELIEQMREKKNSVFESCITDRMREQFGQTGD